MNHEAMQALVSVRFTPKAQAGTDRSSKLSSTKDHKIATIGLHPVLLLAAIAGDMKPTVVVILAPAVVRVVLLAVTLLAGGLTLAFLLLELLENLCR